MTAFELHELLSHNRELISETYNFFLTVQLSIFGLVFIANGRVTFRNRFVIVLAYLGFSYVNYMAQADSYDLQKLLIEQIMALPADADGNTARAILLSPEMPWITEHLEIGYAVVAAVSSIIILATRFLRD